MSRDRRWRALVARVVLPACLLVASPAAMAQSPAEKAQAQALFDEGRKLLEAGNIAEACEAFGESQRLDPAIGTQLNLASCLEKQGRTASAWALYVEVATRARRDGQSERETLASERAAALEPTLSKLIVEVEQKVPGLEVTHNGVRVTENLWGKPVPVDPGEQIVVAQAPGKKTWTGAVTVAADAARASISVPALADAPVVKKPEDKPDAPDNLPVEDGTVQWALGWTALGVGVAASGVGVVLRVLALEKNDESFEHCDPEDPEGVCTQEGADLRDDAQLLQTGSIIAWAAGGTFIVGGIVLLVTTPSDDAPEVEAAGMDWSLAPGPGDAGIGLVARW